MQQAGTLTGPFGFEADAQYQTDADSGLTLVGNRYYDSAVGRFIQPDPSGQEENEYAYAVNNPLSFNDPDGLTPGAPQNKHPGKHGTRKGKGRGVHPGVFKTADAAAIAAIRSINPKSIKENREYAGHIYKRKDGTYGYNPPNPGTANHSGPLSSPSGTQTVGRYHTHGDNIPDANGNYYDSEHYSPADKANAEYEGVPSYLGTPSGAIYKYIPVPGKPGDGTVKQIGKGAL